MNNPVGWFEIYVEDLERAKAFYEAVFDIQLSKLDGTEVEMLGFPRQPEKYGAPGALVKMPGFPVGANSVLVYFTCEDCAVEANRARQAGGRIHKEKSSIGQYGFIAFMIDTEGNMIGLHSLH